MIEINLLPAEKRKKIKKAPSFKLEFLQGKLIPIALGVGGLLLVTYLLVALAAGIKGRSLRVLNKQWQEIQPQKKEMAALKAQTMDLNVKTAVLEKLRQGRFLWSEKLNQLSDSMIPGVWLTQLCVEQKSMKAPEGLSSSRTGGREEGVQTVLKEVLILKGSAISLGDEEATATVGKFMNTLRENKDFFKDFEEIKLGKIRRRMIKDVEVMDFDLECYFKKLEF